jgi:hypothetical protein
MVKRTTPDFASDKLNTQDAAIVNHPLSSDRSRSKDSLFNDDVIVSLADAYENQRARQVTEWEKRQRVAAAF